LNSPTKVTLDIERLLFTGCAFFLPTRTRDQCYDFGNIFAEKIVEKLEKRSILTQNTTFMPKSKYNNGFEEETPFLSQKMNEKRKNSYHNIDPDDFCENIAHKSTAFVCDQ
jgi:hypothetical protein